MGYLSLLIYWNNCWGTQVSLPLLTFVYKDVNSLFINSTNNTTQSFVETSHRYSWHKRPTVFQYYQYSRNATANFSWLGPIDVSFDMWPTAFYSSLRRNTHLEVELCPLTLFYDTQLSNLTLITWIAVFYLRIHLSAGCCGPSRLILFESEQQVTSDFHNESVIWTRNCHVTPPPPSQPRVTWSFVKVSTNQLWAVCPKCYPASLIPCQFPVLFPLSGVYICMVPPPAFVL